MRDSKKWTYIFLIIFTGISISAITPAVIKNRQTFDSRTEASEQVEQGRDEISGTPRVVSVAPTVVYAGQEFNFFLKIVDSDTDLSDIEVELIEAPGWVLFDKEALKIHGTPVLGVSDTERVELKIDDGLNSITYKFYLLVVESDEEAN